ncbi:MAG: FtsX-like permease family protein, partial [Propionibacteriaceae bacterium]|nr:FtsX-like permease family protein [Propionibacteriaceae bacterium]
MFRSALRELRFHPGRFAATLVAVAIAVGFMAAASVVTATEDHAMGRQQTMRYGAADLVVGVTGGPRSVGAHEVTAALAAVPGVAAVEPSDTTLEPVESASGTGLVNITALPGEPFRSTALAAGRWPTAPGEVVLGRAAAQDLEVGVGDSLRTVHSKATLTVVGLVDLPKSRLGALAFTSDVAQFGHERFGPYGRWIVKAAPGGDLDALADALRDAVAGLQVEAEALSLDSVAQEASGNIDSFKYLLWVFAAIAMTVGAITIANTFTITLAQRRRQIGLLRAVGALGSQVRRSILAEAVLLGLTGSVLGLGLAVGLAAIVGAFTGSLHWGLVLLPADLGLAAGLGTLITVAAAVAPVLRSTRVKPLEALQPVAAATGPGRRSAVRIAFCAVTLAAGLGLALVSLQADGDALVIAIGAALLVTASVLVGAPLFVPALVRCLGAAAGLLGPTVRLAKANALRNPRRIAATATALMLAVGL